MGMIILGLRQISMLILAAGMVVLGALGLTGAVAPSPVLGVALLIAAIVLAFDAGRRSVSL